MKRRTGCRCSTGYEGLAADGSSRTGPQAAGGTVVGGDATTGAPATTGGGGEGAAAGQQLPRHVGQAACADRAAERRASRMMVINFTDRNLS